MAKRDSSPCKARTIRHTPSGPICWQTVRFSNDLRHVCEASMASEELVLDRKVRDWVVVPLTLCILLMMLLRQYVSKVCCFSMPAAAELALTPLQRGNAVAYRCWRVLVPANSLWTPRNCVKSKPLQGPSLCGRTPDTSQRLQSSSEGTSLLPRSGTQRAQAIAHCKLLISLRSLSVTK